MTEKTPWNPSRKATARVRNPLPTPTECNNCGGEVKIIHHDDLYGRAYSDWPWMYKCSGCDSYVGMHPFTNIPLGTLADSETREARKQCKSIFERLFKRGKMTRSEAYARLAEKLGIETGECHFGWFDVAMCRKAKAAAEELAHGI